MFFCRNQAHGSQLTIQNKCSYLSYLSYQRSLYNEKGGKSDLDLPLFQSYKGV